MPRRLVVEIVGDTAKLERALKGSQANLTKFKKVAAGAALGAGAAVAYGLGKVAKIGWDEFNQGQKVAAQTNAVLKSTGGVANVTAKDVERLGVELMKKSGIDDEVIKSGENVLLTFRGIRNEVGKGNDIFDQAVKATLDLSVAMGKDMNSAAVMVGKALQDPARGLTALRRVGIQFTKAQEEQIKRLVESGQTMKAQKMILRELRIEFEGSAEAAGKTLGGQINILRERFNNWAGDMVGKAIPVIEQFAAWLRREILPSVRQFAAVVREEWPAIRQMLVTIGKAVAKLTPLFRLYFRVVSIGFRLQVKVAASVVRAIASIIQAGDRLVQWFRGTLQPAILKVWNAVRDRTIVVFNTIRNLVTSRLERIRAVFALVRNTALFTWDFIRDKAMIVVGVIRDIIGLIQRLVREIKAIPGKVAGPLGKLGGLFGGVKGIIRSGIGAVGDFGSFGLGRTSLVALGRQLQSMGFQVGEHPAFGGVSGVHVPGSYHYQGRALDINWPGGGGAEMGRLDWLHSRLQRMPGIKELLWRTAGHFDHLHVAMDRGGVVPGPRGAPVPVLAHGGETFIPTHRTGGSWGRPIQVNVQLGRKTLGSVIVDLDEEYRQQNGGRSLLG